MNDAVVKLLRDQVCKELNSAYIYLEFSEYFAVNGLTGFAHWYRIQSQEEVMHAMKFVDYLNENGINANLCERNGTGEEAFDINRHISEEESLCDSVGRLLKLGLGQEKYITRLIDDICTEASSCNDYRTLDFLDWFIREQTEEEKNAMELLNNFTLFAAGCKAGLMLTDRRLASRKA